MKHGTAIRRALYGEASDLPASARQGSKAYLSGETVAERYHDNSSHTAFEEGVDCAQDLTRQTDEVHVGLDHHSLDFAQAVGDAVRVWLGETTRRPEMPEQGSLFRTMAKLQTTMGLRRRYQYGEAGPSSDQEQ